MFASKHELLFLTCPCCVFPITGPKGGGQQRLNGRTWRGPWRWSAGNTELSVREGSDWQLQGIGEGTLEKKRGVKWLMNENSKGCDQGHWEAVLHVGDSMIPGVR